MTNSEGTEGVASRRPSLDGPAVAHPNERNLDLVTLKALAHPLRVQIFDTLSIYGFFTASGLAERLGESSGATSYHLRQLEKHGLVREVEGKGTSRERWWERTPGSVTISSPDVTDTPAGRSAANAIFRQMRYNEDKLLGEFIDRAIDEMPVDWQEAAVIATSNSRLTPAQLRDFAVAVMGLIDEYVLPFKNQNVPGARPVHVVFNAFPVIDGDVVPDSSSN